MKELISKLTWADYVALVALLWGLFIGYKSGFFHELLRLVGYAVTIVVALLFHEELAQLLTLHSPLNAPTARATAFGALLAATYIVTVVVRIILVKLLKVSEKGGLNRLLGMALGGARWLVLLSFLFMGVDASPLKQMQQDVHQRSLTGDTISQAAPTLLQFLSQMAPQLFPSKEKA